MSDVDLFVIGAGSGGVRAGRIAAGHGARVMVAEEHRVGGTCVIRGCVPKKLYVVASRFGDAFRDAAGFGWDVPEPRFDFAALKRAKDVEIARLERAYRANLERSGAALVEGRAVVEDATTVRLADGARVRAGTILVATGAWPTVPDVPGVDLADTSNEVFEWEHLPEAVLIVGGGYIAVEFACLLHRLGAEVTLVYRGGRILRGFDDDLREALDAAMRASGIRILAPADVARLEGRRGDLAATLTTGERLSAARVVYATGRAPNTRGLGLDAAGVRLNLVGAVQVDDYSRSSVPSIYAVGDVTARVNLTPVAIREGHAFADTVFGGQPTRFDHRLVASAVFSTPEIGTVGLTETQARERCAETVVYKTSFRPLKATLSGGSERVLMKLLVEGGSDRVVGCHVLGEGAAEMIQLADVAIRMGATKRDFDASLAVHPTAAEELVTMRTPWTGPAAAG